MVYSHELEHIVYWHNKHFKLGGGGPQIFWRVDAYMFVCVLRPINSEVI